MQKITLGITRLLEILGRDYGIEKLYCVSKAPFMWGDVVPEKRDTLPAEPTFCFLCKRFAKFCKEM